MKALGAALLAGFVTFILLTVADAKRDADCARAGGHIVHQFLGGLCVSPDGRILN